MRKKSAVLTELSSVNQNGQVVFQRMNLEPVPKVASVGLNEEQTAMLLDELKRTGLSLTSVLRKHKLTKLSDMGSPAPG